MGVIREVITKGDGINFPKKGDTVSMHYVGTLASGKKFDSSRDRGSPFVTKIGVQQVIKGYPCCNTDGTRVSRSCRLAKRAC